MSLSLVKICESTHQDVYVANQIARTIEARRRKSLAKHTKGLKMLTEIEKEMVSEFVDDYIDGLRMEVMNLCGSRIITEQPGSKIVVVDKDLLIDQSRGYEVILRNPVEEYFFIPKEIDYYETQFDLEFDRKDGFKITNLADVGVIDSDAIPIDDHRISDDCLSNLVSRMCFDMRYQQMFPEVKTMIAEFLDGNSSPDLDNIKNRIRPFIQTKES